LVRIQPPTQEKKIMKKLFICFYVGDGSSSESYSTYYAEIVEAENREEAIDIYLSASKVFNPTNKKSDYDAIEKKLLK